MPERIIDKPINDIIHESFIEYAQEVIEERALPDVRDGLKPVQRRILYTMLESGFVPEKPFRKSAATVGQTMKDLHPHGDMAIYNALVKMAQTFNKRYILVSGHGNFGTLDDSPAAMRYTESKLSPIAMQMLKDIEKNTVEWQNNYDDTLQEPVVLPAMFPNLIVNGGSGIAVGIASEIPPHNLGETIDGIIAYMKNPKITTKELLQYITGPDFPTGGIVSPQGLLGCYETGKGSITMRGRVNIEELPDDKRQLIITEIPFQVSKNSLLAKMAKYIEGRKVDDVVEIRDESDKNGNRIVIEMDKGGNAEQLLTELFDKTELQINFNYNMVALVNRKPKTLSLKDMIVKFIEHKKEIVKRRTEYDLQKAKDRHHILEGLIRAVSIIDDVIAVIRKSKSQKEAKENLVQKLSFTEVQAQAIVDMRLGRLTVLDSKTLQSELKDVQKAIKVFETILSSEKNILKEIEAQLLEIKETSGDERKSLIREFDQIEIRTRIEKFTLQINDKGKVKKLAENYKGDKGFVLKTDSTKNICMFDTDGEILKFTGITCPQSLETSVANLCNEDEVSDEADITFITTDGQIKKTAFKEYKAVKSNSQAIKLNSPAKVANVLIGEIPNEIVVVTKNGMAIRFDHTDVRQMGRVATGVRAIKLDDGDLIVGAIALDTKDGEINIQTEKGIEKINLSMIKTQGRGGKGINIIKNTTIQKLLGA